MKVIRKDISTGRGVFLNPSDLSPIFDRLRAQSAEPMAAGVLGPDFLVISTEPTSRGLPCGNRRARGRRLRRVLLKDASRPAPDMLR